MAAKNTTIEMSEGESKVAWRCGDLPPHLRAFRQQAMWRDVSLGSIARDRAMTNPEATVFVETSQLLGDIVSDAEAMAIGLMELGLRAGDVVSFQLPNWHECAVINLAASMVGIVVNPIVPIYRDAEVIQMLSDCGSRALFLAPEFRNFDYRAMMVRLRKTLPKLDHLVFVRDDASNGYESLIEAGRGRALNTPTPDPNAVKLLLYTSGTSGRPKAVLHSQNSCTRFIEACAKHWSVQAGDTFLMPSPVTHITGYAFGLEMPFLIRSQTLLMDTWDARRAVALIENYKVVGTVSATPFLQELVDAARAAGSTLPSLRIFGCGGASVPASLIEDVNRTLNGNPSFRVFGCSELPMITLGWPGPNREELAATTDGEIIDYEVRIVGPDGLSVPAGEEGEILARGPSMFLGYADPAQNAEAITSEGFFRTGDLGVVTAAKALIITGRKKDLIIRGGENISAKEIEDVLHRSPDIAEAAVVSMPHPRLGEGVCAFIVPVPGRNPNGAAIAAFIAGQGLARQKIPEHIELVDTLPKTASGKVRKDVLRTLIHELLVSRET
jgi:acyl-CoA synthetase (AMP-forming)/AMP-acid ligase II